MGDSVIQALGLTLPASPFEGRGQMMDAFGGRKGLMGTMNKYIGMPADQRGAPPTGMIVPNTPYAKEKEMMKALGGEKGLFEMVNKFISGRAAAPAPGGPPPAPGADRPLYDWSGLGATLPLAGVASQPNYTNPPPPTSGGYWTQWKDPSAPKTTTKSKSGGKAKVALAG